MNGKTAKRLRVLFEENNPFILLKLTQVYGNQTKEMTRRQVYQNLKKLVRTKQIQPRKLYKEKKEMETNANN
jgi:hypothetical protein